MLTVLGVDVSPGLLERWVDWLAPDEQPFFLTKKQAAEWGLPVDDDQKPTPEQRDTYLAGTFPDGSGPNCFGTVMAACGVDGADGVWMQREPFEQWLAEHTTTGGRDDAPGTVFVWRDAGQAVQHAAITLGDGWMLHKPSQSWMSPRKVRTVGEVKRSTRTAGWRLQRRSVGL
jgi:hypothetical protein